jgi:hypothetical protein
MSLNEFFNHKYCPSFHPGSMTRANSLMLKLTHPHNNEEVSVYTYKRKEVKK